MIKALHDHGAATLQRLTTIANGEGLGTIAAFIPSPLFPHMAAVAFLNDEVITVAIVDASTHEVDALASTTDWNSANKMVTAAATMQRHEDEADFIAGGYASEGTIGWTGPWAS